MQRTNTLVVVLLILLGVGMVLQKTVFSPAEKKIVDVVEAKEEGSIVALPKQVRDWDSTAVPIDDMTIDMLDTKDISFRRYFTRKGRQSDIYVILVYSALNRLGNHPPEVCLRGGGFKIIKKEPFLLAFSGVTVNKLVMQEEAKKQVVLYWYAAGDTFYRDFLRQQVSIVISHLKRNPQGGSMIRLSAMVDNTEEETTEKLVSFAQDLFPFLKKELVAAGEK